MLFPLEPEASGQKPIMRKFLLEAYVVSQMGLHKQAIILLDIVENCC